MAMEVKQPLKLVEKPVSGLFLDPKNPRLSARHMDEKDIIRELVEQEEVMELVKSFCLFDYLPNEALFVVEENSKHYVVEGNRRLCALKLINQPFLYPSGKTKIEKIVAKKPSAFDFNEVPVYLITREYANTILLTRHTGNPIRKWGRVMQVNFYRNLLDDGSNIAKLSGDYGIEKKKIENLLKMEQWYKLAKGLPVDNELKEKINSEKKFPFSTLERIAETQIFSEFMGIEYDDAMKIHGKIHKEEFAKPYIKIISDIVNKKVNTRIINKVESINKYFDGFDESEKPNYDKKGSFTVDDFSGLSAVPTKPKPILKKKRKSSYLIPEDMQFGLKSESVKNIFLELQSEISVDKCSNATVVLFRSFLEMSIYLYLEEKGLIEEIEKKYSRGNLYLRQMLEYIIKNPECGISKKVAEAAHTTLEAKEDSLFSIKTLNAAVHNPHLSLNSQQVRNIWENFEGLVRAILKG